MAFHRVWVSLFAVCIVCILILTGCGQGGYNTAEDLPEARTNASTPLGIGALEAHTIRTLPDYLDCVREAGGVLIAAHRGGPGPGLPENALETLQNTHLKATHVMEIDVATSRDGVLFLMHDDRLERTSNGRGRAEDTDWRNIATLRLKDMKGTLTAYHPPRLREVLLWAVRAEAIIEIDRKGTTRFTDIIGEIRAAKAENAVILIAYNDAQALDITRLAPELMLSLPVSSRTHQRALESRGLDATKLIAWTGTERPNPRAFAAIAARGVEPAFGTLGRPGQRLDDIYLADGDASEYKALIKAGLTLLATDAAAKVAALIDADDVARTACGP